MESSFCIFCIKPKSLAVELLQRKGYRMISHSYCKLATVYPFLKKPSVDSSVSSNFRSIHKPCFYHIIEKMSPQQIKFFERFQSRICSLHSTETALVKVTKDLLLANNTGLYFISVLLDFSSVPITVCCSVIISCLVIYAGLWIGPSPICRTDAS